MDNFVMGFLVAFLIVFLIGNVIGMVNLRKTRNKLLDMEKEFREHQIYLENRLREEETQKHNELKDIVNDINATIDSRINKLENKITQSKS